MKLSNPTEKPSVDDASVFPRAFKSAFSFNSETFFGSSQERMTQDLAAASTTGSLMIAKSKPPSRPEYNEDGSTEVIPNFKPLAVIILQEFSCTKNYMSFPASSEG